MRIAVVGCGYAADLYMHTMANHRSITVVGCHDRDPLRQKAFAAQHGLSGYDSLDRLLDDPAVELVLNVTNPTSHGAVTRAALLAGKHVYVEKPIALDLDEALELARLAERGGRQLRSAPCGLLGEAAQTVWQALRAGVIGTPRLAYAELDAGPLLRAGFQNWVSDSGAPWPYLDEFRTGCVVEHAAYYLSWVTAFLGPATGLTAFAAPLSPNPFLAEAGEPPVPDFAVAALSFAGGAAARVTVGSVAPKDQGLRIVGDEGVLSVADGSHFESPVTLVPRAGEPPVHLPLRRTGPGTEGYNWYHHFDFARGVADLAGVVAGAEDHLPLDHALHVLELTLALAGAGPGRTLVPRTTFAPVPPAAWARE